MLLSYLKFEDKIGDFNFEMGIFGDIKLKIGDMSQNFSGNTGKLELD